MRKIDIEAQKNFGGDTLLLLHNYAENNISISEFVDELTKEERKQVMREVINAGARKYGSRKNFADAIMKDLELNRLNLTEEEVLSSKSNPFKAKIIKILIAMLAFEVALALVAFIMNKYSDGSKEVFAIGQTFIGLGSLSLTENILSFFKYKKVKKKVEYIHEIEQRYEENKRKSNDLNQTEQNKELS